MLKITTANNGDYKAIAKLHAQSWQYAYRGILADHYLDGEIETERLNVWQERFKTPPANQQIIVAKQDNNIVGFICVYGNNNETLGSIVDNIHVTRELKGGGIGKKLIAAASHWLETNFPNEGIYLEVLAGNTNAIGFYEAIGGKRVKHSIWHAPCGTDVEEYYYAWDNPQTMLSKL